MSIPMSVDDHPWLMSRFEMAITLCGLMLALTTIGLTVIVERLGWPFVRLYRRFR